MLVDEVKRFRVVPVLVLNNSDWAEKIGQSLVEHDLPLVELTLRTPSAFDSLKKFVTIDRLKVGVGSVQTVDQMEKAQALGASFAVSAGINEKLLLKAKELGFDYLPGVSTPSEILSAIEYGLETLKWFPAGALGGPETLKAISAPFPNITFVPTGGITPKNMKEYLALDSVLGVGGSWMFSKSESEEEYFAKLKEALVEIKE